MLAGPWAPLPSRTRRESASSYEVMPVPQPSPRSLPLDLVTSGGRRQAGDPTPARTRSWQPGSRARRECTCCMTGSARRRAHRASGSARRLVGGAIGVEHDEVRLRIDRAHHPRVGLVEELLPRVGVPSPAQRRVIGVLDCCERRRDGYGADILGQSACTKHGGGLAAGNGVADAKPARP